MATNTNTNTNTANEKGTKMDNSAKRLNDVMKRLEACEYVRKGCKVEELEGIAAAIKHTDKLTSDIDAAGGARASFVVCFKRYSAVSGWQTLVAIPVGVGSTKVCPAGNTTPETDSTWYVDATAADIEAANSGNSNRVYSFKNNEGKAVRIKGNARTGAPVKVKMSLRKYFNEYVGEDMKNALFDAIPATSTDYEKDVAIKSRHYQIELVPTKSVNVLVRK